MSVNIINTIINARRVGKRRTGNVLVILLIALVPILGFGALAVDYGVLVNDKNRLQRACDAASLAAAQELKVSGNDDDDKSNATTVAIATAGENGVEITKSKVAFSSDTSQITVSANLERGLFFARILGIFRGETSASATAGVGGVASNYSPYVAPVGIVIDDYNKYKFEGTDYTPTGHTFTMIRHNKQPLGDNDLALFDLRRNNGKSPSKMQDQLIGEDKPTPTVHIYNGSRCTNTSCHQSLNASRNAQGDFYAEGLDTLIDKAAKAPWDDASGNNGSDLTFYNNIVEGTADYSNPRIINLIVTVPSPAQDGNSNMPVLAFVPVYITGYTGDGKNSDLKVTFQFLPTPTDLEPELQTGSTRVLQLLN